MSDDLEMAVAGTTYFLVCLFTFTVCKLLGIPHDWYVVFSFGSFIFTTGFCFNWKKISKDWKHIKIE